MTFNTVVNSLLSTDLQLVKAYDYDYLEYIYNNTITPQTL